MSSTTASRRILAVIAVTLAVFLVDLYYVLYITAHGLEPKLQQASLGPVNFAVPLEWLPVIGIVLVSLVGWYEASLRIFPRRTPQFDPLGRLRYIRAVVISFMLFACILYIPYLLGSYWFWAGMGGLTKSASQLNDFALWLLSVNDSFITVVPLWQYSLSQVLATTAMVFIAWVAARPPRIFRRPR